MTHKIYRGKVAILGINFQCLGFQFPKTGLNSHFEATSLFLADIFGKKRTDMDSTILRIKNLKKEYFLDKFNRNLVIPGLNLKIEKGEFTVIMGNSGSGKSTLLYLIGGLEEPTDGEVWLNNKILPIDPKKNALLRRTSFGVVFQQNNLIPSLNLLENILISAFLVQKKPERSKIARIGINGRTWY